MNPDPHAPPPADADADDGRTFEPTVESTRKTIRRQPRLPGASPSPVDATLPGQRATTPPTRRTTPPSPSGRTTSPPGTAAHAATFNNRYHVAGELGRGGLGLVLDASDERIGRGLAIKVLLRPEGRALTRFVDEARITGQLEHPNIIPVYDLGEDDQQRPFMAMKRVRGHTLSEIIRDLRAARARATLADLRKDRRLEIFLKVCDAIDYAHSRRVIHRDLKPDNVMVGEFGDVLVMDWGIARLLDAPLDDDAPPDRTPLAPDDRSVRRADNAAQLTAEGDVIGTPAFMPPEQANGELAQMGPHSDVFALGAILYHMLTFEPPYRGESVFRVMAMAARAEWVPPRTKAPRAGIPRELDAIVCKALAADPADRYPTVAALRDDIRAFLADEPVSARRDPLAARLGKWMRRHPRVTQASILLVVAGLAISTLLLQLQATQSQAARATELAAAADRERTLKSQLYDLQASKLEAIVEFRQRYEASTRHGLNTHAVVADMTPGQVQGYIEAFNRFFAARQAAHEPVDDMDHVLHALLLDAGLGDRAAALVELDSVIGHSTEPHVLIRAYYNRGLVRSSQGDYRASLDDMAEVLKLDPQHAAAHCDRGTAFQRLGRLDDALAEFNAALAIAPDHTFSLVNRGIVYWHLGRFGDAVADYNAALAYDPQFHFARIQRSRAHLAQDRFDDALRDIDYVLRRSPGNIAAWSERGRVLHVKGELADAEAAFSTVIEIKPDDAVALANRGSVRYSMKQHEPALADLDAAIRLRPELGFAWYMRGNVHADMNRHADAVDDYTHALAIDDGYWEARANRGNSHQALGHRDQALADLRAAYPKATASKREVMARRIRALGGEVPGPE
ncbi:MAG: tetratricopeptide repeat protein [Planctomycetota bacterium]